MEKNSYLQLVQDWHTKFKQPVGKAPRLPSRQRLNLRQNLIREEIDELEDAYNNGDLIKVADSFADIMYILCGSIIEFGMQDKFDEVFNEVHRSNMTKLDDKGNPILREDGKVLKSKNFEPPYLINIIKL